jgi:hypothetical protein
LTNCAAPYLLLLLAVFGIRRFTPGQPGMIFAHRENGEVTFEYGPKVYYGELTLDQ